MSCFVSFRFSLVGRNQLGGRWRRSSLSKEKREPFLDRREWKCINTQRRMQNEHSDAPGRGACGINQGGLFRTGHGANFCLNNNSQEMHNYATAGFSLSAPAIWPNLFVEKLFFSFYWTNWISQKNPIIYIPPPPALNILWSKVVWVEWMRRHYGCLKYGQKNWPLVNLITGLSSISHVLLPS